MNNILIIGFAMLIGISTAGIVWYVWGFTENFSVVLHNKKIPNDEPAGDEPKATENTKA